MQAALDLRKKAKAFKKWSAKSQPLKESLTEALISDTHRFSQCVQSDSQLIAAIQQTLKLTEQMDSDLVLYDSGTFRVRDYESDEVYTVPAEAVEGSLTQ